MSEECSDGVLELAIGDDWSIPAVIKRKNGDKLNITGFTEFSIKFKKNDGTFLTKVMTGYAPGNGITIVDSPNGSILIEVPKAETVDVKEAELADHSIVTTNAAGKERTARMLKKLTFFKR